MHRNATPLYSLEEIRWGGVYMFSTENRPSNLCKVGVCSDFGRRFGELCTHDRPDRCIFLLCIFVRITLDETELLDDDATDIRMLMGDLETLILDNTREEQAPGMRGEWRHLDVDALKQQLIEYVDEYPENPCFQLGYEENIRPEIPTRPSDAYPPPIEPPLIHTTPQTVQTAPSLQVQLVQPVQPVQLVHPRSHQSLCLAIMKTHFDSQDRGHIVQACGVGKALLCVFFLQMMYELHEPTEPHLYIIGVPSVILVKQMLDEVRKIFATCPILCVMGNTLQGVVCTSDSATIEQWDSAHANAVRVLSTTYASSGKVAIAALTAHVLVADECHHLVRNNANTSLHPATSTHDTTRPNRSWQAFWDISATKSLFLTATPLYAEEEGGGGGNTHGTMSDVSKFGARLHGCDRSVKWAIENKCIVDYNVILMDHREEEVDTMMEELFPDKPIDDDFNQLFLSTLITLKTIVKYVAVCGVGTHFLIYVNTIEQADTIDSIVQFILEKQILHGIPSTLYHKALHSRCVCDVEQELATFKASAYGIVACAYLLSEGFNMPELNGVCVALPMKAHVRITQSLLRPNRLYAAHPDKKALILLPTIDIDEYNPTHPGEKHANIRQFLDELRDSDDACDSKVIICSAAGLEQDDDDDEPRKTARPPPGSAFEYVDDTRKMHRFRIKMVRAGRTTPEAKLQAEYKELRRHNRQRGISTIEQYNSLHRTHPTVYVAQPQEHFERGCALFRESAWAGWSHFLGHDVSQLPRTKHEWRTACKERGLRTAEQYSQWVNGQPHGAPLLLPHEPENFYTLQNDEFTSLTAELEQLWARAGHRAHRRR
jgi:hypothetical protein